jgi:cytochrome P450
VLLFCSPGTRPPRPRSPSPCTCSATIPTSSSASATRCGRCWANDRVPTAADAARLTYTTMVIKEAMRLYPPVYAIARRTAAADTIGGYHLPAGSLVLVSTWVVHRHPRHWDQPASFDLSPQPPQRTAGADDRAAANRSHPRRTAGCVDDCGHLSTLQRPISSPRRSPARGLSSCRTPVISATSKPLKRSTGQSGTFSTTSAAEHLSATSPRAPTTKQRPGNRRRRDRHPRAHSYRDRRWLTPPSRSYGIPA